MSDTQVEEVPICEECHWHQPYYSDYTHERQPQYDRCGSSQVNNQSRRKIAWREHDAAMERITLYQYDSEPLQEDRDLYCSIARMEQGPLTLCGKAGRYFTEMSDADLAEREALAKKHLEVKEEEERITRRAKRASRTMNWLMFTAWVSIIVAMIIKD